MSRYNHFAPVRYTRINFSSLQIGQEFRMPKWKGGIMRYLIMQKTGELNYIEARTKTEHVLHSSDLIVYKTNKTNPTK